MKKKVFREKHKMMEKSTNREENVEKVQAKKKTNKSNKKKEE